MWIDSHCHLNSEKIRDLGTPETLIANAHAAGVDGMVTINSRIVTEFPEILTIAQNNRNVWCTIGTHPHEASRDDEKNITLDELIKRAQSDENIVGIGESGLDYFYHHSTPEDQQESFRKHIRACVATDLPLVVHARDADDDIIKILREEGAGKLRGVMHCFSSGPKLAEAAIDIGFYISFSGILTFKKAEELRAIAKSVPHDRLLVETDAPYLAPEPHRGKLNQPALVARTGQVLAETIGLTIEETASITARNFFTLFNRAKLI